MGLLTTKEKTPEEKRISELMSRPIDSSIKGPLKQSLKKMAQDGNSIEEIDAFYKETVAKVQFIEKRREEYIREAKLADKVYKAYITDGVSRLEKVNGRFLASQSIKTDILIEQNNRIIELLELLLNKGTGNSPVAFCPKCGNQNISKEAEFCAECGSKLN
ncbi:MAG: hypothetical protein PWQ15_1934 [Methanobacterium sp.]|uniref:zinc ribbon domain-containing protein n=2 Tax=Methanobacterium TaxID=2160 RepID=UPI0003C96937|nr:zinc ribbon domain-containing protein [Methanobacterium sp.]MDI3550831.1 hypothetical protein [Methanobacterium sp.]CDG65705.1 hypothetical protein MBMB1_1614 [Methanobacterium sp. MB1]